MRFLPIPIRRPYEVREFIMAKPRVKDLNWLFSEGDSQVVELKTAVPPPDDLARLISSFANSDNGGTIVLGLDEQKTHILSVDETQAKRYLDQALDLNTPRPETNLYSLNTIRGRLLCIDVEPSNTAPVAAEGVFLRRVGSTEQLMSPSEINNMLQNSSERYYFADLLAAQSRKIDKIRQHQLESRSWRQRVPDLLLGALVGAILSVVLTKIFL